MAVVGSVGGKEVGAGCGSSLWLSGTKRMIKPIAAQIAAVIRTSWIFTHIDRNLFLSGGSSDGASGASKVFSLEWPLSISLGGAKVLLNSTLGS